MTKILVPLVLVVVFVVAASSCADDEPAALGDGRDSTPPTTTTTAPITAPITTPTTTPPDVEPGTVTVRLEAVDGFFIEGFEIGLRFETGGGAVIDSMLWSDFVNDKGGDGAIEDPSIDDYYQAVLEQSVPPGPVVVLATVNVGIGPGPEIPDLEGDLRCRVEIDVPAGAVIDLEANFSGTDDCLTVL